MVTTNSYTEWPTDALLEHYRVMCLERDNVVARMKKRVTADALDEEEWDESVSDEGAALAMQSALDAMKNELQKRETAGADPQEAQETDRSYRPTDDWVSVTDRLPISGNDVLVWFSFHKSGVMAVQKLIRDEESLLRYAWNNPGGRATPVEESEITHWRPLPPPP